jgi:hypothetical protein
MEGVVRKVEYRNTMAKSGILANCRVDGITNMDGYETGYLPNLPNPDWRNEKVV